MSKYAATLNFFCTLHLEFLNALLSKDFFNTLLNVAAGPALGGKAIDQLLSCFRLITTRELEDIFCSRSKEVFIMEIFSPCKPRSCMR